MKDIVVALREVVGRSPDGTRRSRWWIGVGLFLLLSVRSVSGQEMTEILRDLSEGDAAAQTLALKALADTGNPEAMPLLTALHQGSLHLWTDLVGIERVVILRTVEDPSGEEHDALVDAISGKVVREWDELEETEETLEMISVATSEGRRWLQAALDRIRLFHPSSDERRSAAVKIGNGGDRSALSLLRQVVVGEPDRWARHAMEEAIEQLRLSDPDPNIRRDAAIRLGEIKGHQSLPRLKTLAADSSLEPDASVREAIVASVRRIENYQFWELLWGTLFSGVSLGSILLLMGLGLAITFGLMGVINMAHGEMMMIGAYATFVIQEVFSTQLPGTLQDFYFLVALPVSFLITAIVGWGLEKSVIRFLYKKPLETLLATWGVSMILQQSARWYFGDLTSVNAPTWMRGGVQAMTNLVLPYNRIFIIFLSLGGLMAVRMLLSRTRWGLRIRAVTQNRDISACLGIPTGKVDAMTFALGAGLAGLAGCALSLVGNVDPEMGKTYIVDSFMVVVVGGVGKLAGTVVSAMGIGMLNKILEPMIGGTGGAIYAKLFILGVIILFLQRRPSGLFPAKGRGADTT